MEKFRVRELVYEKVKKKDINTEVFFSLLRAGLWENYPIRGEGIMVICPSNVDWNKVYQLAEEQSVIGLLLAGIEHSNVKPPQELLLQWIGEVQILEQQNKAMNLFVVELIEKLRKEDIYALLLKGQGVAQCYGRPFWRCCGDVDLFLNDTSYTYAKELLKPIATSVEPEEIKSKHLGMTINSWTVELHGTLYCGISGRINKVLDELQHDVVYGGYARSWLNGKTQVFLPGVDVDAVYVFTHFLNHFYKGGLGLRQICDWCRLLWVYKNSLNHGLLETRLKKAGLMSEWKAFGAFAVVCLGMPSEAMPFYDADEKWKKKADKICSFILEVGNMGHNRDMSYFERYPYLIRKVFSLGRRCGDLIRHAKIFPLESLRFVPYMVYNGMIAVARGE